MDNPFKSPAVLSFCPGLLGLERGLEQAIGKLRVTAYVEIETWVIANLIAGMESGILDPAPVWTDAKTFDASPFYKKIHGIIGGYPCPGESLAGLREGHLYKGFIWPSIRKAIAATRPVWCFFENVDDHLSGTFPIVQRSLHAMGYAVEAGVYTAEEVGAPHERKRLFILALAVPYKMAARGRVADVLRPGKANEREAWLKNGQWSGNGIGSSSSELANTKSGKPGKQGSRNGRKGARGRSQELEQTADQGICKSISEKEPTEFIQTGGNISQPNGSKELAYPTGTGQPQFGNDAEPDGTGNDRACNTGTELGNANSIGLQGHDNIQREHGEEIEYEDQRREINRANQPLGSKYPAGQGYFQYDWEEKRTIEPGLGVSAYGYNHREDILRAIGNSVVADCAEIAFIDLLNKHLK